MYPDGPLDVSKPKKDMPPFFRGYRQLLTRIKCVFIYIFCLTFKELFLLLGRELLGHLTSDQLTVLEQALCSAEGIGTLARKKLPRSPGRSEDIPCEQILQSGIATERDDRHHIHELQSPNKPIHSAEPDHHVTPNPPPPQSPGEGTPHHIPLERRKAPVSVGRA